MNELIIDTETTGLTNLSFANQRNYKKWPRLVQLAYLLCDDDRIIQSEKITIHPTGFEIPPQATQIHGINQAHAIRHGQTIRQALMTLSAQLHKADTIIAHNLQFDLGILESEAMRLDLKLSLPPKRHCTVHMGQAYLKKESEQQRIDFPRLGDLYQKLFGFDYGLKHDPKNDVTACWHIYKYFKKLGYAE